MEWDHRYSRGPAEVYYRDAFMSLRFIAIPFGGVLLAAACSTESGQSPAIGSPGMSQPVGAASPTAAAVLWAPEGLAFGADGALYASDCVGGRIYRVDP